MGRRRQDQELAVRRSVRGRILPKISGLEDRLVNADIVPGTHVERGYGDRLGAVVVTHGVVPPGVAEVTGHEFQEIVRECSRLVHDVDQGERPHELLPIRLRQSRRRGVVVFANPGKLLVGQSRWRLERVLDARFEIPWKRRREIKHAALEP